MTARCPRAATLSRIRRRTSSLYAARAFLVDNDPKPAVENVKKNLKIYPYQPGSFGTSIAQALEGTVRIAGEPEVPETKFIEGSGLSFNTIPPSDYGFFELINENVQNEPATSYDVELAGQLAAIGIVHGKAFAPDERMKKILSDAAAVGQAAGRALNWRYAMSIPDWAYYEGSQWGSMLWEGGAFFETPPPHLRGRHVQAAAADRRAHARFPHRLLLRLHARFAGHDHAYPGRGLAVSHGLPRSRREPIRRREDLQGDAAQGHSGRGFWSFTLYDNQTRSMLQTPQKYPRAGSQSYPSPAAEAAADGSTTVYFGPTQPEGVARGNWIQTDPGKGWFTILRLYSPLPVVLRQDWRPSEIEPVE